LEKDRIPKSRKGELLRSQIGSGD